MTYNIYQSFCDAPVGNLNFNELLNNQRVLTGTDPFILTDRGIFLLEVLIVTGSGTVNITDGKDKVVGDKIATFYSSLTPLRCDYGIKITGDVSYAMGYLIQNVLPVQ